MRNSKNNRICVISGTFDPPTVGHLDLIMRALELFDKIYVVSLDNSSKKTMFNNAERLEMLRLACEDIEGSEKITVEATNELLVDYAKSKNAGFIVRGVRNVSDYDYEYSMFLINKEIGNNIETVVFPARSEHLYISSAFVREMIKYKRDISKYVPAKVNEFIIFRFKL